MISSSPCFFLLLSSTTSSDGKAQGYTWSFFTPVSMLWLWWLHSSLPAIISINTWSAHVFVCFLVAGHSSGIHFLDFIPWNSIPMAPCSSREHLVQYWRACHHGTGYFRLQQGVRIKYSLVIAECSRVRKDILSNWPLPEKKCRRNRKTIKAFFTVAVTKGNAEFAN